MLTRAKGTVRNYQRKRKAEPLEGPTLGGQLGRPQELGPSNERDSAWESGPALTNATLAPGRGAEL